jgi:hypothetical protein
MKMTMPIAFSHHHCFLPWLLLLATTCIACRALAEEPVPASVPVLVECKESSSDTCANPDESSSSSAWGESIWEEEVYFLPDLWDHFECDYHYEYPGPLYSQETWMNLRQVYHDVVGSTESSIGSPVSEEDGFSVAVQVKQSESKGRSLFATQDIKKGEHIWSGMKQVALFDNDVDFKTFLARIPEQIACDHLHHLGFVQLFGQDNDNMDDDARIGAILDDRAFVSELPREDAAADADLANAGCIPEWKDQYPGGCNQNLFALKDIRAGQEIVVEDADSNTPDDWEWFNMGPFLAHERDALEQMRQEEGFYDRLISPWSQYNCDDASVWPFPRPLYSQDMWMRLRKAYVDIVGSTKSSIGTEALVEDGFLLSVEVKQAPGKGRGLFAAEDIYRGQHIWISKQTASFDSGEDFTNFLDALEVGEACDVIQWSYVHAISGAADEGATQISTDLDNMTFINQIMTDDEDPDAGCLPEWEARHPGGRSMNIYALRDIKDGEEILMNYGEFAISDGWSDFGLA